ncbi:MAG TPA: hypothetical protein VLN45_04770, partial [Ignavibacteriaceae bacterium]|nr:hypothetical protein [Ignavibacteriaceae bacterium]
MKKILLIIFFSILIPQNFSQVTDKIVEYEKEKYFKTFHQKDLKYPGDPSYDVTYYKLNLTVSYSPQHLSGEVTIAAKSLINNLTSFFV